MRWWALDPPSRRRGIDVFPIEPKARATNLFRRCVRDNVLLTPHRRQHGRNHQNIGIEVAAKLINYGDGSTLFAVNFPEGICCPSGKHRRCTFIAMCPVCWRKVNVCILEAKLNIVGQYHAD